jgi:hypothetical protein
MKHLENDTDRNSQPKPVCAAGFKVAFFFLRTLQVSTFLAGLFELYFSSASFLLAVLSGS